MTGERGEGDSLFVNNPVLMFYFDQNTDLFSKFFNFFPPLYLTDKCLILLNKSIRRLQHSDFEMKSIIKVLFNETK